MSERIMPTGSPEDMPFRIEPKETKKVEKIEKSSTHPKIKKEPHVDVFESTQNPEKEGEETEEEDKDLEVKKDSKEEDLDIYT